MKTSEKIDQVATSLLAAKKEFQPAFKTATNPAFHSKYVDLASALEACDAALLKNGLIVIQGAQGSIVDKSVTIATRILHTGGQWIEDELCLPAISRGAEYTAQSVGSAITYGRRYAYMALLGIAPEDDDANAASGKDKALVSVDSYGNAVPVPLRPVAKPPATVQAIAPRPGAKGPTEMVFIESANEKVSANGKSYMVVTSTGNQRYSVWETSFFPAAVANIGRTLPLGIKVDAKGYKTIISGLEPIADDLTSQLEASLERAIY